MHQCIAFASFFLSFSIYDCVSVLFFARANFLLVSKIKFKKMNLKNCMRFTTIFFKPSNEFQTCFLCSWFLFLFAFFWHKRTKTTKMCNNNFMYIYIYMYSFISILYNVYAVFFTVFCLNVGCRSNINKEEGTKRN